MFVSVTSWSARIAFETEKILPVEYDGLAIDLGYRVDLLVEGEVMWRSKP
jgi:hypothetical protein